MMSFLHRFIKIYSLSISASFLRQKKIKIIFILFLSFPFSLGAHFEPEEHKFPIPATPRKDRDRSVPRVGAAEPLSPSIPVGVQGSKGCRGPLVPPSKGELLGLPAVWEHRAAAALSSMHGVLFGKLPHQQPARPAWHHGQTGDISDR